MEFKYSQTCDVQTLFQVPEYALYKSRIYYYMYY